MHKHGTTDLTQGPITKNLLIYFLPIAAGNIFHQFYNMVDTIVVGKFVGTDAIAAVGGSASSIVNILAFLMIALLSGASVVIAQLYGAGDEEGVSRASHTATAFTLILSAAITVLMELIAPWMLHMMKTPDEIYSDSLDYVRIFLFGTVFVLIYNMGAGVLRAVGDSRRPFIYLIISCVVNIVLDLVFVAVLGWAVKGVAYATVISQFISAVLVAERLLCTDECYRVSLKKLKLHHNMLRRILRVGVPAMLQSAMYNVANLLIQVGVNSLGTAVIAGWTLIGKIDGFFFSMTNAAGTAVATFIGQNYGAGNFDRIKKSVRNSLFIFTGLTIAMNLAVYLIGPQIFSLFADDPEIIALSWKIEMYFLPFYWLWALVEIYSSSLRGVNDVIVPVIICAVCVAVYRIVWLYTVFVWYHDVRTIAMCFPISWALAVIPMAIRYYRGHWMPKEQ